VLTQGAVAIVLLQGLMRRRLAHAAVSRLVVDLGRSPEGVEAALARAVGDPTLTVAFWLPARRHYVDDRGQLFEPDDVGPDRMLTPVERDGSKLALLLHDPTLDEEPGLVEAAAAAAGLALENARLQAEVRAQLLEVEQSRARIVQAADDERRRLERDIHDGAQQRLVALALSLRVAGQKMQGEDGAHVEKVLDDAVDELQRAVRELRELARGVYPAILTEEGLGAAMSSLAGRSAIPVLVLAVPDERPAPEIEAAAYFVICEAVTNAAKHSGASLVSIDVRYERPRLVATISDNGRGGARLGAGSGLSGLADRVAARRGTLTVQSPVGAGTTIVAEFPCEP
jgi:signal transduction histidine kinase